MIRRVISCGVAVATGVATVTALGHAVDEVPAWLAFIMGALVVIATLTGTSVRAGWRSIEEGDDSEDSQDRRAESVRYLGRHRNDNPRFVRGDRDPDTLTR